MAASNDEQANPEIVLLGDLASHVMLVREPSGSEDEPPYRPYRRGQHEPLLPEMIEKALAGGDAGFKKGKDIFPKWASVSQEVDDRMRDVCGERISVLGLFPRASNKRDGPKALRVKHEYLASTDLADVEDKDAYFASTVQETLKHSARPHRLVVLYDHSGYTRQAIGSCCKSKSCFANLIDVVESATDALIVGINGDAEEWIDPLTKLFSKISHRPPRVVIQVAVDTLRKAGLNITKYGALEETIKDIFECESKSPLKELLTLADDLIVIFRETGSLHIKGYPNATTASLHYCPNSDKLAQADFATYGGMPGKFAIFLTSLLKAFYWAAKEGKSEPDIPAALRLGAVAYNRLFSEGLRSSGNEKEKDPFGAIVDALSIETCEKMAKECNDSIKRDLLACSLDLTREDIARWSKETAKGNKDTEVAAMAKDWDRTATFLRKQPGPVGEEELAKKLRRIVRWGMHHTLIAQPFQAKDDDHTSSPKREPAATAPWFPPRYIDVPYAAFNNLKLIDKKEIADHYSLAKVIRKYIETPDWTEPLSIAVFGRPGSGKSFAVKQVLASVDPGRKSEPLTFNLAQFNTVDQLTDAFHQIQDRALASNEVPLAIFDEFDAHFDKPLGWLKYFLAPMQDGLFRGKSGDYKVGRAIFLFSGGTSYDFKEFSSPINAVGRGAATHSPDETVHAIAGLEADNTRQPAGNGANAWNEKNLRSSKLADFISRLRGYLDILDVNSDNGDVDLAKLRRAVKLRSLLEIHAKPILIAYSNGVERARITDSIIDGFLERRFIHGVRSMEAVIQMSRWIDGRFVPASLPSEDQLALHVEGKGFAVQGITKPSAGE